MSPILVNLEHVQQDYDSAHDVFQTQNIGIKDIRAHGNVDIKMVLQNLYDKAQHHHHHPMMHGVQQDHDSKKDLFQTQNIGIKDIKTDGTVDISLQNLYNKAQHHHHPKMHVQQDHDSAHDVF